MKPGTNIRTADQDEGARIMKFAGRIGDMLLPFVDAGVSMGMIATALGTLFGTLCATGGLSEDDAIELVRNAHRLQARKMTPPAPVATETKEKN